MKGYLLMYESYVTRQGCKVVRSIALQQGRMVENIELSVEEDEVTDSRHLRDSKREDRPVGG